MLHVDVTVRHTPVGLRLPDMLQRTLAWVAGVVVATVVVNEAVADEGAHRRRTEPAPRADDVAIRDVRVTKLGVVATPTRLSKQRLAQRAGVALKTIDTHVVLSADQLSDHGAHMKIFGALEVDPEHDRIQIARLPGTWAGVIVRFRAAKDRRYLLQCTGNGTGQKWRFKVGDLVHVVSGTDQPSVVVTAAHSGTASFTFGATDSAVFHVFACSITSMR
jgi:hypothetical protein